MQLLTQEQFIAESRIVTRQLSRDRGRLIAPTAVAAVICWLGGAAEFSALLVGAFALLQTLHLRPFGNASLNEKAGLWGAIGTWLLVATVLASFMAPPFATSLQGSTGVLICGLLWLLGILFYVSYSYGEAPLFNWSLLSLASVGVVIFVCLSVAAPRTASNNMEIAAALGILALMLTTSYRTVIQQTETVTEIGRARDDARAQMKKMVYFTNHDSLTDLMTRRAFDDSVGALLAQGRCVTVLLIDLDGFKPINDSYSHAAGDAVLSAVGRRLKRRSEKDDIIARLGGDEFAIATTRKLTRGEVEAKAKNIAALISEPIRFEQRLLSVSASVGIAHGDSGTTLQNLMIHADQAMYFAKEISGPSACYYDAATFPVRATFKDRAILLAALENDEITPFYQPKYNIKTQEIIGMEALARWQHPTRGLVMPGQFLPMIDELGIQGEFLMYTLKRTLSHIATLVEDGIQPGFVSVNLPEVTLATVTGRDALLDLIRCHPMSLPYLTFEVTEDIFIARSASMIQKSIQLFRRMGVRISLDDFGTGFASFEHLRELEFDELKLDTGFVQGLGTDPAAQVLIQAFLDIGIGLDVDIIAEGVETKEQEDKLGSMGCVSAQGFLFGRAVPFEEIRAALHSGQLSQGETSVQVA